MKVASADVVVVVVVTVVVVRLVDVELPVRVVVDGIVAVTVVSTKVNDVVVEVDVEVPASLVVILSSVTVVVESIVVVPTITEVSVTCPPLTVSVTPTVDSVVVRSVVVWVTIDVVADRVTVVYSGKITNPPHGQFAGNRTANCLEFVESVDHMGDSTYRGLFSLQRADGAHKTRVSRCNEIKHRFDRIKSTS